MERKEVVVLNKEGLKQTIKARTSRCVGKAMAGIESVYPNGSDQPKEISIVKNFVKNIINEEFRDLENLLLKEHEILFHNYKDPEED